MADGILTLKGQITIHFVDGKILTGEFAAQDALNIFIRVNGEPLMIPRGQVRYIKGRSGQSIEPDDSRLKLTSRREPEETVEIVHPPDEDDDVTMLLSEEDADDVTVLLADEEDATVFLTEDEEDATVHLTQEEEDATVFIEEPDDTTMVIEEKTSEPEQIGITAYLDCTTGPHTGERFELQSGVTTLGRSTDNIFALSKDKEISRRHAMFTYKDGKFVIEDRGSLNGIIINDTRIEGPRQLEHGDSILIGVSTLIFYEK